MANLRELFAKVAEALTGTPTPSAVVRRKRRDETQRSFAMAAAPVTMRGLPASFAEATGYLGDILDWLNRLWNWNQPDQHEQLDQSACAAQHYPTRDL